MDHPVADRHCSRSRCAGGMVSPPLRTSGACSQYRSRSSTFQILHYPTCLPARFRVGISSCCYEQHQNERQKTPRAPRVTPTLATCCYRKRRWTRRCRRQARRYRFLPCVSRQSCSLRSHKRTSTHFQRRGVSTMSAMREGRITNSNSRRPARRAQATRTRAVAGFRPWRPTLPRRCRGSRTTRLRTGFHSSCWSSRPRPPGRIAPR
jgi:hypothetical protein